MKKISLLLSAALTVSASVWAQDVVYRKADGSLSCKVTGASGGMVRVLVAGQKVSLPMADVDSIATMTPLTPTMNMPMWLRSRTTPHGQSTYMCAMISCAAWRRHSLR